MPSSFLCNLKYGSSNYLGPEIERPEMPMDVANRILDVTTSSSSSFSVTDSEISLNTEIDSVSFLMTSTAFLEGAIDVSSTVLSPASMSESTKSSNLRDLSIVTESIVESSDSALAAATEEKSMGSASESSTSKSEISQVGNIIYQLLGETGYNTFSCNLSTAVEDKSLNENKENVQYRRLGGVNQTFETSDNATNDTIERIEFQSVKGESLPKIPENLYANHQLMSLLLKLNIFEVCKFAGNDQQNWTANMLKLKLCSDTISSLKVDMDDSTKMILKKYSHDIQSVLQKFRKIEESKVKIIRIINLTEYLSSTIKDSDLPKDLKNKFDELKQFLLIELRNEDLSNFHPDSNRKDVFMKQLFDYLIQSKIVDQKIKKLLEIFKEYIRSRH